jgi:hypothetical protein
MGLGSGVWFSGEFTSLSGGRHLVLTNAHVVLADDGETLASTVELGVVRQSKASIDCFVPAAVIAYDLVNDLAVLEPLLEPVPGQRCDPTELFMGDGADLPSLTATSLLRSRVPDLGERLTALGFPALGELSLTLSQGVVSGYLYDDLRQIQTITTDAEASPGSSGGPVFDEAGAFVGLMTSLVLDPSAVSKIHHVIPQQVISPWLDAVVTEGLLKRERTPERSCFSDVPASLREVTCALRESGVVAGYADGTFRPSQLLNRAELAKLVVGVGLGELSGVERHHCFPDVASEWFAPAVCEAQMRGVVRGYPDGMFRPAGLVNRAEALAILGRAFDLPAAVGEVHVTDVPVDSWFASSVLAMEQRGILDAGSTTLRPSDPITRGELAEWLYRLLVVRRDGLSFFGQTEQATYVSEAYGYRLDGLSGWLRQPSDTADVAFVNADALSTGVFSVTVELLPAKLTTEEYWAAGSVALSDFRNYRLLSTEEVTVAGQPALLANFLYDAVSGSQRTRVRCRMWVFTHERRAYVLLGAAQAGDFSAEAPAFESFVKSFFTP